MKDTIQLLRKQFISISNEYTDGLFDGIEKHIDDIQKENRELKKRQYSPEVAKKLINMRDEYIKGDFEEVWHILYTIASPNFDKYSDEVWEEMERMAKNKPSL